MLPLLMLPGWGPECSPACAPGRAPGAEERRCCLSAKSAAARCVWAAARCVAAASEGGTPAAAEVEADGAGTLALVLRAKLAPARDSSCDTTVPARAASLRAEPAAEKQSSVEVHAW